MLGHFSPYFISKILEKIVQIRLPTFLETHNLLSDQKFSLRSHQSTTHPLLFLLNQVTSALNDKKHPLVFFCDLKKAFETCNHAILLKILKGTVSPDFKAFFMTYDIKSVP
jgi:hypothetical protein